MTESFDTKWNELYSDGKQLNEHPFTDLVSFFHNAFQGKNSTLQILEVGCGAANNLEFLAKIGHNVYGIDASENVINHAKKKFDEKNLSGNFTVGEFIDLPYEDNFFDLIINRAAICHTDIISANVAMKECHRVLNESGIFYSTFFTNLNTFKANKIDSGYYESFEEGFNDIGALKFYNIFEAKILFEKNNFNITDLYLIEKKDMMNTPTKINSEWIIHSNKIK